MEENVTEEQIDWNKQDEDLPLKYFKDGRERATSSYQEVAQTNFIASIAASLIQITEVLRSIDNKL